MFPIDIDLTNETIIEVNSKNSSMISTSSAATTTDTDSTTETFKDVDLKISSEISTSTAATTTEEQWWDDPIAKEITEADTSTSKSVGSTIGSTSNFESIDTDPAITTSTLKALISTPPNNVVTEIVPDKETSSPPKTEDVTHVMGQTTTERPLISIKSLLSGIYSD